MLEKKDKQVYFIMNNIQDCIVIYDKQGCIKYCNDILLKFTGYKDDELLEQNPYKLFDNSFEIYENNIQNINLYEETDIVEAVLYRKNQTCFPVEIRIVKVNDVNKEYFICTAVDMTRYRESMRKVEESSQKLQESMRERDSLVANVTHELRTPVNGIKGNTELLIEQEKDFDKLNYLKIILDCCDTMEGIINNLLDFSELEAGKVKLQEKEFSFYGFISKMEKKFTSFAMKKGLRFVINAATDIPDKVIGDEPRLSQILNNLVSNALKFTKQGYVGIEVSLNTIIEDEIELFFMVVDTGIGLSTEDKDKLFKSFAQADASITRKYGGTGLGLPITKELVNMMHGKIWADGEVGKGSSFSFTVRLKQQLNKDESEKTLTEAWKYSNTISSETDFINQFGSEANIHEIEKNYEKLIISIDMENWAKAESFANTLKQLVSGASRDLQRLVFKMEMAIRKAEAFKAKETAMNVKELIYQEMEGC